MSLRRRLVLAFVAIAVVLAVADVVIIRTLNSTLYAQIDDRLAVTSQRGLGPAAPQLVPRSGTAR